MRKSMLNDPDIPLFLKKSPVASEQNFILASPDHTAAKYGHVLLASHPLTRSANILLKRFVDVVLSLILIVLLLPWLLPLLGLLIKMDSKGPVFFLQRRNKRNGKIFTCIKFRSMHVDQDADRLAACEKDKRVTRLGYFIRRHHLDELPQLVNVLVGDMSIIGPRPHMLSDNQQFERLIPNYHERHSVKPGMTGLAQVFGYVGPVANVETIRQRVEKDIHYVQNWSIALDTKIVCWTILRMIQGNGGRML